MNICIYDLASSYKVRVVDLESNRVLLSYSLPPALIEEDRKHANFRCSFFDPENPDFASFVTVSEDFKFAYDNSGLLTLTEIMYSLCWRTQWDWAWVEEYFKDVIKKLAVVFYERNIKIDRTVILVPDALPLESQEKLLSVFGRYNTKLLWHSVAVALANEDILFSVSDGEKVAIIDEFSCIGLFTSKIEVKKENCRAIPCHKIYRKASGKTSCYYLPLQEDKLYDALKKEVEVDRLAFCFRQFKMDKELAQLPIEREKISYNKDFNIEIKKASSFIGPSNVTVNNFHLSSARTRDMVESGFLGAVKFVEYIRKGEVPYYDECETFSIISQNEKEELEYFVLIKKNSYLPGGRDTIGRKIDTMCIPQGSKEAKFFFHLGDINKDDSDKVQLRKYTQTFPIKDVLHENRPLLLSPSVIPGQGYARIIIEDNGVNKLFSPIELDWKNIELAFDNKTPVTKSYLEKTLERSFPPDVPPVISRFWSSYATPSSLADDLYTMVSPNDKLVMFYNKPEFPYSDDEGVRRFVRTNVFGSFSDKYGSECSFPKVRGQGIKKEEYIKRFVYYATLYTKGNNSNMVLLLAWSYLRYDLEGKEILVMTKATDKVINELKNRTNFTLPPEYASYLANMIVKQDEFEKVISLFNDALKWKGGGVGNWCRAMYQVIMYTSFIYSDNRKIGLYAISCMNYLIPHLYSAVNNGNWQTLDYILRVILYLLKRRVRDKSFCRENSSDGLYSYVINALNYTRSQLIKPTLYDTIDTIIKYMNGKGTLDGIPKPLAD